MKTQYLTTGLIILLTFCSQIILAQTEEKPILVTIETLERDFGKKKPVKVRTKSPKATTTKNNKDYFRHHKRLPKTFDGFAIELTTSDFPLSRNYHLFEQFGMVYFEKSNNVGYAYLIMIDFSSKKAIEDYIKNIIVHKAPEAKLVEYKKGKRVK